jgi:SAM-dependent methyltransferase
MPQLSPSEANSSSAATYNAQKYWESRLRDNFSLRGTGHICFNETYNGWLYRRKRTVINSVFDKRDLRACRVLDIGCGTGFFVDWYTRRGANVTGIDITEVSVRELAKRFQGSFFTQDITDARYEPKGMFDVVNMWDVLYHIVDEQAFARALSNIARSLTTGGLFLMTDWLKAPPGFRASSYVRSREIQLYTQELGARGFALQRLLPLYKTLNESHFNERIDNHLGWLYYSLDAFQTQPAPDNLSVGVWLKK